MRLQPAGSMGGSPWPRAPFQDIGAGAKPIALRTLSDELLAGFRTDGVASVTTFELESHGGYSHTVTGTIAYFDDEARTIMVREPDGQLARVPLRDVTSARSGSSRLLEMGSDRDVDGLGTGDRRRA